MRQRCLNVESTMWSFEFRIFFFFYKKSTVSKISSLMCLELANLQCASLFGEYFQILFANFQWTSRAKSCPRYSLASRIQIKILHAQPSRGGELCLPNFTSSSCLIETHQRLFSETLNYMPIGDSRNFWVIRHPDIWQLNDLPNLTSQKLDLSNFIWQFVLWRPLVMTFVSWFLWFPSAFHFLVALVSQWLSLIFH